MLEKLIKEIEKNQNSKKAQEMQKFFKTAKGEYAYKQEGFCKSFLIVQNKLS